jgi:hypothetical protein
MALNPSNESLIVPEATEDALEAEATKELETQASDKSDEDSMPPCPKCSTSKQVAFIAFLQYIPLHPNFEFFF